MQRQITSTSETLELQCVAGLIVCEIWQLITNRVCNSFGVEGESHISILACKYSKMTPTIGELNVIFPGK